MFSKCKDQINCDPNQNGIFAYIIPLHPTVLYVKTDMHTS